MRARNAKRAATPGPRETEELNMKNGKARSHDPGPMPALATFCRHCNASFPVAIPIFGARKDEECFTVMQTLATHVTTKHPEQVQQDGPAQMRFAFGFSGQLMMAHFTTTDERLQSWLDRERHAIFRAMLRSSVTDEKIERKVADLFHLASVRKDGPHLPTPGEVILLVKSMRDAIEERNLYPEPAPSPVLTV